MFVIYVAILTVLILVSLAALFWFAFNEDLALSTKVFALLLFGVPLVLQFLDPLPDQVHFLIPWTLQIGLIAWWIVLQKGDSA